MARAENLPPKSLGLAGDGDEIAALRDVEHYFGVSLDYSDAQHWETVGDVFTALQRALPADKADATATWTDFAKSISKQTGVDASLLNTNTRLIGKNAGIGYRAYALIIIGLMALFEFVGWLENAGLSSIASAVSTLKSKPPTIEIDGAGLRFPIIVALCVVLLPIFAALRIDLSKRKWQFVVIFSVIGGGFIVDAIYGEKAITYFMADKGYNRCQSLDRHVGKGKGSIWLKGYAASASECPPNSRSTS